MTHVEKLRELASWSAEDAWRCRQRKEHPNVIAEAQAASNACHAGVEAILKLAEMGSVASRALGVLSWLIHLNRGVGKDGSAPSHSEWEAAWLDAETLVFDPDISVPVSAPDASYPGRGSSESR